MGDRHRLRQLGGGPERVVRALAEDLRLASQASTYREARAIVDQLQVIWLPGVDEEDFEDDEPYAVNDFEDWAPRLATMVLGDWPDWDTVLGDFAEVRDEMGGVPEVVLDPDREPEVLSALRQHGYKVESDHGLVSLTQR